jgi:hypothetical protein
MIDVRAARSIQFSDLKTDDHFIFLGRPRSDPWSTFFNDQLDFRFAFDKHRSPDLVQPFAVPKLGHAMPKIKIG